MEGPAAGANVLAQLKLLGWRRPLLMGSFVRRGGKGDGKDRSV